MRDTARVSGVWFRPAAEVAEVAGPIMDEFHEELCEVEVRFVFRSKAAKRAGHTVWGTAEVVRGKSAFLALGPNPPEGGALPGEADFFLITIAEDIWENLSDERRCALVDHELSHCYLDVDDEGNVKLRTRGHDLEEFCRIVERHGFWREDVGRFADQVLTTAQTAFGVDLGGAR